ncbi:MAG: Crp/Fnr family transcriptional regulator [Desulfobacteraceae bacterium]|nr:Crp/Fnr family transcriptional regulator [Desulfobacteraceae bacterium]
MKCFCKELAGDGISLSQICFSDLWFFYDLAPDEMEALNKASTRKKYEAGETIFLQEDSADIIFLIKAGRIKLTKVTKDGSKIVLDYRKTGDTIGENLFSEETNYPVSAKCLEPTLICGLKKADFEKLILAYPRISLQIIKNMSQRISKLTNRLGSMASISLEDRLYNVLSNIAAEHGKKTLEGTAILLSLTHEEMGFLIGAHRVSITKTMKALIDSGRLLKSGKTIILPPRI